MASELRMRVSRAQCRIAARFWAKSRQTQFSNFIAPAWLLVPQLTAVTVFSGLLLSSPLDHAYNHPPILFGPILIANCLACTLYALLVLLLFLSLSLSPTPCISFYFYATLVSHSVIRLTPLDGAVSVCPVMALLTQLQRWRRFPAPISAFRILPFSHCFLSFSFFNCKCEHFV